MDKQQKHTVKLSLIGALAASAINCVIVSRETGIVALATARQSGNDDPSHFLVTSALVGTGDEFKLWRGVDIAIERACMGEGLIYRHATASPENVLEKFVEDNSDTVYHDGEIYTLESVGASLKMKKAFKEWDAMGEWAQKEHTDNFGAPRMADTQGNRDNAPAMADTLNPSESWPFPKGSKPE